MKKIGFIVAYDKTDLITYVSKILVELGKSVLFVDGTITQKARYIIPTIEPSTTYITQYEGIDVAVGFETLEGIKSYLGIPETEELNYDIIIIDADTADSVTNFKIENCDKIYFATSFDMYSIRRGVESISGIYSPINVTKVLFSKEASREEDDYLNYMTSNSKIIWDQEKIYFPFELGDQTVIYKNQRVSKIKLRKLTTQYKEGLLYIAMQISGEEDYQKMKKVFKKIEKGV